MRFGAAGGVGVGVGNNAWNNDSPAVFQGRMRELATRLPSVVLAESPTLRMYLAIQTNNMDQFKSAIESGAIMDNDFSHVSRHLHMLRDDIHGGGGGAANGQEARVTRKNPLEYAIDCVTVGKCSFSSFYVFPTFFAQEQLDKCIERLTTSKVPC